LEPLIGDQNGLLREIVAILEDPDQKEALMEQLNQGREDHG
jgi:hypothetical protein